jgi:hypothetical protein
VVAYGEQPREIRKGGSSPQKSSSSQALDILTADKTGPANVTLWDGCVDDFMAYLATPNLDLKPVI